MTTSSEALELNVAQLNARPRLGNLRAAAGWLFKCWHGDVSRPFTLDGETYRVCLRCGARRRFVAASWKTVGAYYHHSRSR